jgi:hypothetical protein
MKISSFIKFGLFFVFSGGLSLFAQTPEPPPTAASSSAVSPSKEPSQTALDKSGDEINTSRASKTVPVTIPRFEVAPTIDGQLNEKEWQAAAIFGDFLQTQPGDNIAPTAPMEAMIGYDSKNFYIAFRVKQDKSKIRATVGRRDQLPSDDFVAVYLDTFNDQRQAYFFFLNPYGLQTDGVFSEGRGEDMSVDMVFESKGEITEEGYTVEAAIPFKSLRYEAGKNKLWGIHLFRRIQYANRELDSWMPLKRGSTATLNQAGHITGLEGISTTRQLEINPSITISESGSRLRTVPQSIINQRGIFNPLINPNGVLDPGRFVNEGVKADLGFTAKFSLTPTTTLDFAYNPDFAQVEADAPVVTANQRFPIFFAEKRPFFLERIDIFQTRMNVVNTRTIVDPDIAVKLTGRRGKNTFGVLYASDNYPGYLAFTQDQRTDPTLRSGIERFLNKNSDVGILRLKRDVGRQNNLGFFATTYNFVDRHNNAAGFDARFRLNPKMGFEFQVTGTTTRGYFYDPDLNRNLYRTGNGFGYSYLAEKSGRHLYMSLNGVGRTRDYRADVGFTPRTNTNQHRSYVRYITEQKPKEKIIYKRLQNDSIMSFDWQGRMQDWKSNTQAMMVLQKQTYIGGGTEFGYERVFEEEFGARRSATRPGAFFGADSERSAHFGGLYGFVELNPNKKIYSNVYLSYTKGRLDYDLGNGNDFPRVSLPFLSYQAALDEYFRRFQANPNDPANIRPVRPGFDPGAGDNLYLDVVFRYQPTSALQTQLNYTKTRLVRDDTQRTAFDDNIFSWRTIYQFSPSTFVRARVDYSTLSTRLRPQIILGWTPSPGTAVYAGYNDDLSYQGYNPFTRQFEPGFTRNGRTFFIKLAYLFRRSIG